jgi:hypothetical protein
MKAAIVMALAASAAGAQPFSAGVKLGLPLTDFLNTLQSGSYKASSYTNKYIIGVTGELHLPAGFSVEVDALYRHFNYQSATTLIDAATSAYATSNAWEFPLLLKYKFPSKIVRPYIDGGVAWDTLQGLSETITTTIAPSHTTTTTTSNPSELMNNTTMGLVFGGGLEVKALLIKLSPEVRFTYWTNQHFNALNLLNSKQSQAEFLLGITF